jgi:hypothetical protein
VARGRGRKNRKKYDAFSVCLETNAVMIASFRVFACVPQSQTGSSSKRQGECCYYLLLGFRYYVSIIDPWHKAARTGVWILEPQKCELAE